jgi:hypothetical protein
MLWWNIIAISILAALAVATSDSKSATNYNAHDANNNIVHHRELIGLNQVRQLLVTVSPPFNIYYCDVDRTYMLTNIMHPSPLTPQQQHT